MPVFTEESVQMLTEWRRFWHVTQRRADLLLVRFA